jgi:hypothetical protein
LQHRRSGPKAFKGTEGRAIGNELANTRKIRTLQSFIARRRRSPEYRFYLLYDDVWRSDVRALCVGVGESQRCRIRR